MIIIVEGPDGAGKDLLCSVLRKATKYDIIHLDHDNYERPFNKDLYEKLLNDNDNVIFNRFYHSEVVYSRVKNRDCDLGDSDCRALDMLIQEKDCVVLYLTQDYKILRKRMTKRGDSFINAHELKVAKDAYDIIMSKKEYVSEIKLDLPEIMKNAL